MSIDSLKIMTTLCKAKKGGNNQEALHAQQLTNSWCADTTRRIFRSKNHNNAKTNHGYHLFVFFTHPSTSSHASANDVNTARKVNTWQTYITSKNNHIDTIEYSILSSEQHKSP